MRTPPRFILFLIPLVSAALALFAARADAKDIFVDNVGGDDGAGGEYAQPTPERSGPVQTLAKALSLAGRGDRIVLKKNEQSYREPISLAGGSHGGYPSRPFTILGNGAVIDGSAAVPDSLWEHYEGDVYRFQPRRLRYQQIFLDDRPAVCVPVEGTAKNPPKLKPREWCLFRGYVYFATEASKRPEDYNLAYAKEQTGVTLANVQYVTIADLTIQGFQIDGVAAVTGAQDVTLERLTCRGNGRSGLSVGGASHVAVQQCLLGDNGEAQLLTLPLSRTQISDSQLLPKTAPAWVDRGGQVFVDGKEVKGGLEIIDGKKD